MNFINMIFKFLYIEKRENWNRFLVSFTWCNWLLHVRLLSLNKFTLLIMGLLVEAFTTTSVRAYFFMQLWWHFYFLMSFRIVQNGLDTKVERSRKQLKERKNRAKKIRGVKKVNSSFHLKPLELMKILLKQSEVSF